MTEERLVRSGYRGRKREQWGTCSSRSRYGTNSARWQDVTHGSGQRCRTGPQTGASRTKEHICTRCYARSDGGPRVTNERRRLPAPDVQGVVREMSAREKDVEWFGRPTDEWIEEMVAGPGSIWRLRDVSVTEDK